MQKVGAGESTLYLYRLGPQGYVAASKEPLGDLAWAYLKTRPDWRKMKKAPEYHISAGLLKGLDDNYRKLGVHWPANRYLLIGLWGDADVKGRKPMQTGVVNGWRCRYDLETGKFDVPPIFSAGNAKAVVPEFARRLLTISWRHTDAVFSLKSSLASSQSTISSIAAVTCGTGLIERKITYFQF